MGDAVQVSIDLIYYVVRIKSIDTSRTQVVR